MTESDKTKVGYDNTRSAEEICACNASCCSHFALECMEERREWVKMADRAIAIVAAIAFAVGIGLSALSFALLYVLVLR